MRVRQSGMTFVFLSDILQTTKCEVDKSKDIILYNNGIRSLTPRNYL